MIKDMVDFITGLIFIVVAFLLSALLPYLEVNVIIINFIFAVFFIIGILNIAISFVDKNKREDE